MVIEKDISVELQVDLEEIQTKDLLDEVIHRLKDPLDKAKFLARLMTGCEGDTKEIHVCQALLKHAETEGIYNLFTIIEEEVEYEDD